MRQMLTLDPERTALLLVDLQEEQKHVPEYTVDGIDGILANAQRLLDTARGKAIRVFYAAYKRDFDKVPPRPLEHRSADGGPAFSNKDSPLTAICAEVAPRAGEPVIHKNDASAFCEGDLEPLLRKAHVEWLVVAGVWTEACVAATVRDAITHGMRVLLVKDACGSGTKAMHQTGIINLANRLSGGAVTSTEKACRLMAGSAADVWVAERPVPLLFGYTDAEQLYEAL
jgi:maleamate amidohydrolase